ncbi:MAG TPA: XRE family transcriptional regulator [Streptosporangiaceae bacterium]|nr:XRE family transcriptional regulator [Streptosporangiaceae bacterium]
MRLRGGPEGRTPYPRLRWKLATLLGADEFDLWPDLMAARTAVARPAEVVAIYPHRWSVPRDAWHRLLSGASREIGILAYSGLFIAEDAGIAGALIDRAGAGVSVRIALGDPDCAQVAERGTFEGIDSAMAAKIRNALVLYRPLEQVSNAEIRLHRTVLYNSIYFADDEVLVNQHVSGTAAANSPVLHLRRDGQGDLTEGYIASFERIWASARRLD